MKNKNVVKRTGKSIALVVALVIAFSSCKKDIVKPDNAALNDPENIAPANVTEKGFKPSQPISLNGAHDITIRGYLISGGERSCISLVNCYNIRITNCKLTNSGISGVNLNECSTITMDSCYVENAPAGLYALNSKSIAVKNNKMKNIRGAEPGSVLVQFDNFSADSKEASSNNATNNQLID